MNYILFDDARRAHLLPLTFTRPVADIRVGIMTIREKWEHILSCTTSSLTESYLSVKYPIIKEDQNILINGGLIPTKELVSAIESLKPGQSLVKGECVLALYVSANELDELSGDENNDGEENLSHDEEKEIQFPNDITKIAHTWDIFKYNGQEIEADFALLTEGRESAMIPEHNQVLCPENIFVEEGAQIDFATINAKNAKIYIGKNAKIQEGVLIRGSLALCENAQLNMGAKIYGPTTIGPFSKVGGEVNNSVVFGFSNKGHDGFLGHSVIAEWCNLGADTNTSNLKNTYEPVRLWNYALKTFEKTGEQFCGLIMGDHSKCSINTMFNTGTVIGVNANLYGSGFHRNFVPSYSWGSPAGMKSFQLKKAYQIADAVFKRRKKEFDQVEQDILAAVYEQDAM
jgi:UDP-N-acetylglucosamine diphosphorylase/glucosamine-1-phosphate N-acetyltransferase